MKQKKMISEEKQDPVCESLTAVKNEDRSSVCKMFCEPTEVGCRVLFGWLLQSPQAYGQ